MKLKLEKIGLVKQLQITVLAWILRKILIELITTEKLFKAVNNDYSASKQVKKKAYFFKKST